MNFVKTTVLSTIESAIGPRRLGQVIPVPSGRIDRVSLYLEPLITDDSIASASTVSLEVYASDGNGLPTGPILAYDSRSLSGLRGNGLVNFSLSAFVPTTSVLVLSLSGGDSSNLVSWRYQPAPSTGQELLISDDGGASWVKDTTRKFSYVAYSLIPDAVDPDAQTATIQPGILKTQVDDTDAEFTLADLDRTAVQGDTVVVEFGDVVVTLVVDNSGSMTWNDHDGLRFDFLKAYIDDLEGIIPVGVTAKYSIVKFRSRKIGRMSLALQQDVDSTSLAGVRVVRNVTKPLNASDGVIIYEGLAEEILDTNLSVGTTYHYGVFTYDGDGNFSTGGLTDYAQATASPKPPFGVAGFTAAEKIIKSGNFDIGKRKVLLSWVNPQGYDYTSISVVRREDRVPESPEDGDVILTDVPTTTSFLDFDPAADAVNGITYYYRIFTFKSGLKCLQANSRSASVKVSIVDRVWDKAEAPLNVPPLGFDATPPGDPAVTTTPGNRRIWVQWTPADADSKRFVVYYNKTNYPQPKSDDTLLPTYDGEVVYDGTGTDFVHEDLENGQPHFYAVVALDAVGNQSSAVYPPVTRPRAGLNTTLPLKNVEHMTAEAVNSTTNRVSWAFPFAESTTVEAWFGDTVRAISSVTFTDTDPRKTSATFAFTETNRVVTNYYEDDKVDEETAIDFARTPSSQATTITSTVSVTPILDLQNKMSETSVSFHSSIKVEQRSTGALIQEIVTNDATVKFKNPFDISIKNDPEQRIKKKGFKAVCTEDDGPEETLDDFAGVYVRTGDTFNATIETSFRGEALLGDITLAIRILDKETQLPSSIVKLPQTNDQGFALIRTSTVTDELIDRSGEPTGETVQKTIIDLSLPPQDVPGEYVLEVTGVYLGYVKTANLDVKYAPSLNIDLDLAEFNPDGVDFKEQKAYVYFGAPDAPPELKAPVPDETIVEWTISILGGDGAGKPRPFYSLDRVPGKGVRSKTHAGVARNVFFGPATDVEPPKQFTCTDGELWMITAKAKVAGMTAEASGVVELIPYEHLDFNRIFIRLAEDQPNGSTGTALNSAERFADGEDIARFEVVGRPDLDALPADNERSGLYFVDKVVNPPISGQFAPLEDGRVVTMDATFLSGGRSPKDVIIITNMTGSDGVGGTAKAKIEGGRAVFDVKVNAKVVGAIHQVPLPGEFPSNPFYNAEGLIWSESPIVVSLAVRTVVEVAGRPVVFSGGGGSLSLGSPPIYVSYKEPLA